MDDLLRERGCRPDFPLEFVKYGRRFCRPQFVPFSRDLAPRHSLTFDRGSPQAMQSGIGNPTLPGPIVLEARGQANGSQDQLRGPSRGSEPGNFPARFFLQFPRPAMDGAVRASGLRK